MLSLFSFTKSKSQFGQAWLELIKYKNTLHTEGMPLESVTITKEISLAEFVPEDVFLGALREVDSEMAAAEVIMQKALANHAANLRPHSAISP